MVGRYQASRAMAVLPVADRPTEDDSAPMDVFIMTIRVIVRKTTHFTINSLLQHSVGFLAVRVVVAMVVWPHFRTHRGHLTLFNIALRHYPDHYLSSINPSFIPSINISTVFRHRDVKVTHRPTRYHHRKANVVADALSRKSHGVLASLAF